MLKVCRTLPSRLKSLQVTPPLDWAVRCSIPPLTVHCVGWYLSSSCWLLMSPHLFIGVHTLVSRAVPLNSSSKIRLGGGVGVGDGDALGVGVGFGVPEVEAVPLPAQPANINDKRAQTATPENARMSFSSPSFLDTNAEEHHRLWFLVCMLTDSRRGLVRI